MVTDTRTAETTTITQQVADYVTGLRYEDIPLSVVARAKELLAVHWGAALYGQGTRNGQQAVRLAVELGGGGSCSIIGGPDQTGLLEAVFANSALMTSGGRFDVLFPSGVLPGVTVHPAAWAVGEMVKASGRELLAAVIVGYDVMSKLHNGVLPYDLAVPRPTKAAVEPFGVAAAAARLLGLSREQTVDAMAHAGQSVMSLYEGGGSAGQSMIHSLTCRNGVMAAMLAKAGVPGATAIVEGAHGVYRTFFLEEVPDRVYSNLRTLGDDFEITKAEVLRYPVSLTNALPIELTKQLVSDHRLSADRVKAVHLVLPKRRETRESIYGTYPKGPSTVVAIALTDGRFDEARFQAELDAEVLAVRDKVTLGFEDGRDFFYARVEITTTDGQRHTAEGDGPVESPPVDPARWLADNGGAILAEAKLTRLSDLLRHLDEVDDVSQVMACGTPSPQD